MLQTVNKLHRTFPYISRQSFHATTAKMVKVGDSIPSVDLVESNPGDKVNLAKVMKGKGLIIGVPAAFSRSTGSTMHFNPVHQLQSSAKASANKLKAPRAQQLTSPATSRATS